MKITIENLQESITLELKVGGKRLKSIQQNSFNTKINGVETVATRAEITSAEDVIEIIVPMQGCWKLASDKASLRFLPTYGTCAEFKICLV